MVEDDDVTERKRTEHALLESEERYRRLFSQMNEGYCLLELIFDQYNRPIDYRFLEVNSTFAAVTGLVDAVGKRIRDLVPDLQMSWVELYGTVALTGEPVRRVSEATGMDRWFDVSAFKVGGPSSRTVAVDASGDHRLGPGRGPEQEHGGGLRRPHGQAGGLRRAPEATRRQGF